MDGIIGGPPCQGFSDARGSRNVDDKRNNLVSIFIEWIELIKPKFFLMENVTGLKTIDNGNYLRDIILKYEKLGYYVNYKILHSGEFGVPQKRERIIVIGLLKSLSLGNKLHPEPTHIVSETMRGISIPKTNTIEFMKGNVQKYKKFVSIGEAFEGLPKSINNKKTSVELENISTISEYSHFVTKKFKIKKTTNHHANFPKEWEKNIIYRIPEGKIYRSNRFGDRYIGVWDLFSDELSEMEKKILKYIARMQTKKTMMIEKEKADGHISEKNINKEVGNQIDVLENLVKDGWIGSKVIDGIKGYKIKSKAGLRQKYMRMNRSWLSHTIMTRDFKPREKIHPTQDRGISLREGARIQSFPDDFDFIGEFKEIAILIGKIYNNVFLLLINMKIFIIIFILLTVLHPIGDFFMSNRRFGIKHYSELKTKTGWIKLLTSEFFWVVNPLHWLIDSLPLRTHNQYVMGIDYLDKELCELLVDCQLPSSYTYIMRESTDAPKALLVQHHYWKHLAKDQYLHVLANIYFAFIIYLI